VGGWGVIDEDAPPIEKIAWVVADNFKHDVGGFCFMASDYHEFLPLFGIEDLKAELEAHIKSLGKDLVVTITEETYNVWVSWAPRINENAAD
jgi:hypothetical protein